MKIGDKVRLIRVRKSDGEFYTDTGDIPADFNGLIKAKTIGIVVNVSGTGDYPIKVKFNTNQDNYHPDELKIIGGWKMRLEG